MRTCGACRLPLRWDETLQTQWIADEDGSGSGHFYHACPRCCAKAEGTVVPPPRTYPPGRVPPHPTRDDLLPICGLCREAMFEGERTHNIRVTADDALLIGREIVPAAYAACPRCWDTWAPAVMARWTLEGVIHPGQTPEPLL